jgi:guanylate kinase
MKKGLIFVISGPSGSGKTTIIKKLLSFKGIKNLRKTISFTTRPKRLGEKDGIDYDFITHKEFKDKIKNNEILEYTKFIDFYYGTSIKRLKDIIDKGKDALLCLDTRGAFNLKKIYKDRSILIFILPPSKNALKLRLNFRRREEQSELERRLLMAKKELLQAGKFDYAIINDKLESAVKEIALIIRQSKKDRSDNV